MQMLIFTQAESMPVTGRIKLDCYALVCNRKHDGATAEEIRLMLYAHPKTVNARLHELEAEHGLIWAADNEIRMVNGVRGHVYRCYGLVGHPRVRRLCHHCGTFMRRIYRNRTDKWRCLKKGDCRESLRVV
jgi:hypothetical protein